jgi:hypothetical protein
VIVVLENIRRSDGIESATCRAGRRALRTTGRIDGRSGGESHASFGDEHGIRAEHDAHVVVPAGPTATLIVIEPHLPLEVLVQPLRSPPLLQAPHQLLLLDGCSSI